jgi:hypothetical protein
MMTHGTVEIVMQMLYRITKGTPGKFHKNEKDEEWNSWTKRLKKKIMTGELDILFNTN